MPSTATQEIHTGTIDSFYDQDTGLVNDQQTLQKYDFYHPGAQTEFVPGDGVTFLYVKLPNGKVIVNNIQKPA